MVKTNRSTLNLTHEIQHITVCHAGQQWHDTWLSRRTATTTRFNPKGIGCQKQTASRFLSTSDQVGFYLASIHQMVTLEHTSD